jgi:uncharacterized membrane-anchored protein YhcB (DUF1043 family)
MNNNMKIALAGGLILLVGIAIGFAVPTLQQKSAEFDRYVKARNAASNKEEFDQNFDNMVKWFDDYKKQNPGATDADARKAFDELWSKK